MRAAVPRVRAVLAAAALLLAVAGCRTPQFGCDHGRCEAPGAPERLALPAAPCPDCCAIRCETDHVFPGERIRGIEAPLAVTLDPPSTSRPPHASRRGPLNESEQRMAKAAWRYFINNTQAKTGLVNAVDKYPSTTLWDLGSYVGALIAARELALIDKAEFDRRVQAMYATLNQMSLFKDELPNKVYQSATGEKVNYSNKPGEIGWSAIDLGRWLVQSEMLKARYPEHADAVDRFVSRWSFCNMVKDGTLYGADLAAGQSTPKYLQEGRLGYEEYAAKGFAIWGFDVDLAARAAPYQTIPILDIDLPYDSRDPRTLGAHNYVVTESYALDGIELGWDHPLDRSSPDDIATDPWLAEVARRVYRVQERRYEKTGLVTARTEHQLDRAPYFVYDTIFSDGYPWNTITDTGKYVPEFAAVSAKGAMGLWALWDTPYTDLLYRVVEGLVDPERGIAEGLYENGSGAVKAYTANNNGIILEALAYKQGGKLLRQSPNPSPWQTRIADAYKDPGKCHPKPCKDAPSVRCATCGH